jgi:hypothetical protein
MRLHFASTLCAAALIAGHASASQPTAGVTTIVQQRTQDGRVLLTDRPLAGVVTERSWSLRGTAAPAMPPRVDAMQPVLFAAGMPRHIDASWRAVDEDPERERIVRTVLERERMQRFPQRALPQREAAVRGSAGPGSR